MALFTDGNPATLDQVRAFDSALDAVAAAERIDLEAKLGLAAETVAQQVLRFLLEQGGPKSGLDRLGRGLRDVVVSSALRRWHAFETLTAVYGDAYGRQLNDRYSVKWKQFGAAALAASVEVFEMGIGVVRQPLPKPGCPTVLPTGGDALRTTVYLHVSWTNGTRDEGAGSDLTTADLGPGDQITVIAPEEPYVSGWNLYAGLSKDAVVRQNSEPLPLDAGWSMPDAGLGGGARPSEGQQPDHLVIEHRILRRG